MKFILTITFLCATIMVFAQENKNTLLGSFNSKNKKSIYSSFHFDGNGKVSINEMDQYDFFERNDSIIILVDKTYFIFQKQKNNELKGISEWVDGDVLKSKDKTFQYADNNPTKSKRANNLSKYFEINYSDMMNYLAEGDGSFDSLLRDLKKKNEVLCQDNLDLSCIQVFVMTLTEDMGGFDAFINSETQVLKSKPNPTLEKLGQKVIQLGNAEGYGLLSQYYEFINEPEKAQSFKEIGLEKGCKLCLELEMNQFLNNMQEDEN